MNKNLKTRVFPNNNYKSIWFNGKSMRIALNPNLPITDLEFPEFYDVKITNNCLGNCSYCYQDSLCENHYDDIVDNFYEYFNKFTANEKPFQIAFGGGEPTTHPDFCKLIKTCYDLDICPNYTTNGMFIENDNLNDILEYTQNYCGGVAISCHPHLEKYWKPAIKLLRELDNIKLNLHIIISDKKSIDYFNSIYNEYKDVVDYFVLLPYTKKGRAVESEINWQYLIDNIDVNSNKFAFGANFYPYLLRKDLKMEISLYEPEIMSKFLDLKDMKLYKSSFDLT